MPTAVNTILQSESSFKVTFGGWYQRTTLHLSEIYEFLANANSYLELDKAVVKANHEKLNLVSVTRENGYFEYVQAITKDQITIKYYEDGLYVLEMHTQNILKAKEMLETYFSNFLNPAINYIFSLGAPIPKVLANIKTIHPIVVSYPVESTEHVQIDKNLYGQIYSQLVTSELAVFKLKEYIFIAYKENTAVKIDKVIENQIFFREFKDQLEKYLNIHRKIWSEISVIKEQKKIKPKNVGPLNAKLSSYQKSISLITNRINQMGSYVRTRKAIAQDEGTDKQLLNLFQYRFEALIDTLEYIKEIWRMTNDYLNNALKVMTEIESWATNKTLQSLTLLTSINVLANLLNYLAKDTFPKFTTVGLAFLSTLLVLAWGVNKFIEVYQANREKLINIEESGKNI